jgi:hypothetical protein
VRFCKEVEEEWVTSRIKINNKKLLPVLEKVLKGYPNLTQHSLNEFSPPYLAFYHRWQEFLDVIDSESEQETREYLQLLRDGT